MPFLSSTSFHQTHLFLVYLSSRVHEDSARRLCRLLNQTPVGLSTVSGGCYLLLISDETTAYRPCKNSARKFSVYCLCVAPSSIVTCCCVCHVDVKAWAVAHVLQKILWSVVLGPLLVKHGPETGRARNYNNA